MAKSDEGTCRSCGAPMLWVEMVGTGGKNPLDREPDPERGNVLVVGGTGRLLGLHIAGLKEDAREAAKKAGVALRLSHFATCPNREQHRKAGS